MKPWLLTTGKMSLCWILISCLVSLCMIQAERGVAELSSVRLVGGNGSNSGRVEVWYNGTWGTVCNDDFTDNAAIVVCRNLNLPFAEAYKVTNTGWSEPPTKIWLDNVQCTGIEFSLAYCQHNDSGTHNCDHSEDVGVVCTSQRQCSDADNSFDNGKIIAEWQNGGGMYRRYQCRTYYVSNIPDLGDIVFKCIFIKVSGSYGWKSTSAYLTEGGSLYLQNVTCEPDQYSVRLVGGSGSNSGRVEVWYNGTWGTVCNDDFTDIAAIVVCRNLNLPFTEAYLVANIGWPETRIRIWLDDVQCTGFEFSLANCQHNDWGTNNCEHSEDVGVVCTSTELYSVRLVGGSGSNSGRVEIWYNGTWGTVCNDNFTDNAAIVVCRNLNLPFTAAYKVTNTGLSEPPTKIWLDDVQCTGIEFSLANCHHNDWGTNNCEHSEDVGVVCTSNAQSLKCHSECSDHGCWGPGPDKCLKCKAARMAVNNTCLATCGDVPMLYQAENNTCKQCHIQCDGGCSGPGPDQCFDCKKVKVLGQNKTFECMTECPLPVGQLYIYLDENRICRQCDPSCDKGCTGPSSAVKLGGCNTCVLAVNKTLENDTVRCLPQDQEYCPRGFYEKLYRSDVDHPLDKKRVCQQCNHLCLECNGPGNANCPRCRYYNYTIIYSMCVKECPVDTYSYQYQCLHCNDQCLGGCHGNQSQDCYNCLNFKVFVDVDMHKFSCVEKCPDDLPHLVEDKDLDKPTMTVCALDDHPEVKARDAKRTDEKRQHAIDSEILVAVAVSLSFFIVGIPVACCVWKWRRQRIQQMVQRTEVVDTEVPLVSGALNKEIPQPIPEKQYGHHKSASDAKQQRDKVDGRAPQKDEVDGRAPQKDEVDGRAPQKDEVDGRAPQKDEVDGRAPQKDEVDGRAPQKDEVDGRVLFHSP